MAANLVDRFICRREGHKPTLTITKTSGLKVTSYITNCQRCGKTITVTDSVSAGST